MTRVSIIGLGWLGLSLGKTLQKKGYTVKGSTTSSEKLKTFQKESLNCFKLNLNPIPEESGFEDLFDTDILFINVPPRSRTMPEDYHLQQITFLKQMSTAFKIPWVIYVSSTSVYPDDAMTHQEEAIGEAVLVKNSTLLKAESLLFHKSAFDLTIIRFGGLLGVDRVPGKYFSGKEKVIGDSPVNYIHQDDAVQLAAWVIEKGLRNEIYNGVAPLHPKRKSIYERNSLDMGFPPPVSYISAGNQWKIISSEKILATGFQFQYPDPLEFSYTYQ